MSHSSADALRSSGDYRHPAGEVYHSPVLHRAESRFPPGAGLRRVDPRAPREFLASLSSTYRPSVKKIALITGGSAPPGLALAAALGQAGFDLALQYHGSPGGLQEAARQVEAAGRRSLLVEADLQDPAAMTSALAEVGDAYGRLDVLLNLGCRWEDRFARTFNAVRAAAPLLAEAEGTVLNVLQDPFGDGEARDALRHLTRGMAGLLAPRIRVNAVAPPPQEHEPASGSTLTGSAPGAAAALVRTALFVLGSPHLNGEVVLSEPEGPAD